VRAGWERICSAYNLSCIWGFDLLIFDSFAPPGWDVAWPETIPHWCLRGGAGAGNSNPGRKGKMKTLVMAEAALMLALAGAAAPGAAQEVKEVTLKVGDPAPKLKVSKWMQGEPVKAFERDKVYIVEFWATWCGPCRATIPHLNEIHKKYKDKGLIVIGQNVWERQIDAVPKFVKSMGEKMTYRVALDDKEGSEQGQMAETWMAAAGQNGIPAAFVVDKQGMIAWIGHPMQLKESMLDQILAGTFDLKKAATAYALRIKNEAQLTSLWRKFSGNMRSEQWADAETTLADIEQLMPEEDREGLNFTRFRLYLEKKDYPKAFALAQKVSDANLDNAALQNELAWTIATLEETKARDLVLAAKIATRANDAAQGKDASILDTLARVFFLQGQNEKAIESQQKAMDLAEGPMKDQFKKTLDSYKEGKLPPSD
jgi:thiol-disulfide isomerase/thioredoxin